MGQLHVENVVMRDRLDRRVEVAGDLEGRPSVQHLQIGDVRQGPQLREISGPGQLEAVDPTQAGEESKRLASAGLSSNVRIAVVLPAPLGPRKPKTSPASTEKVTSSMPRALP
jgi:hypothetical protein